MNNFSKGGGGGGGQRSFGPQDEFRTKGFHGGGIIYLHSKVSITGTGTILEANGQNTLYPNDVIRNGGGGGMYHLFLFSGIKFIFLNRWCWRHNCYL